MLQRPRCRSLFSKKGGGSGDLESLPFELSSEEVTVAKSEGLAVVDMLVKAQYAKSKGEAKRMIREAGRDQRRSGGRGCHCQH